MPKPSTLPQWASAGTNEAVAPADYKTGGWGAVVRRLANSLYMNWWMHLVYDWIVYLDAGVLDGDVTIDGSLTVNEDLTVLGDTSLAGTLEVDGLITANAGLTAGANQHITVSGTGQYKHGDVKMTMSATSGNPAASGGTFGNGFFTANAAGGFYLNIPLKVGDRLKSVDIQAFGDGAADALTTVYHIDAAGTGVTNIGSTTITNPGGTAVWTTINVTDTTLATREVFQIELVFSATGFVVGSIEYTFDHP